MQYFFHVDNGESLILNIIKHPAYCSKRWSGQTSNIIQVKFFCIKEIGHWRTGGQVNG